MFKIYTVLTYHLAFDNGQLYIYIYVCVCVYICVYKIDVYTLPIL